MMKRICSILMVFCMIFSRFVVPSSAATIGSLGTKKLANHPQLSNFNLVEGYEDYIANGFQVFGVLPVSYMDKTSRDFMATFFDVVTGKNTEYRAVLYYLTLADKRTPDSPGTFSLQFCLTKPEATSKQILVKSTNASPFHFFLSEIEQRVSVNLATGVFLRSDSPSSVSFDGLFPDSNLLYKANLIYGPHVVDELIKTGYLASCSSDVISYYPENLMFVDDLNPQPEPPASSTPTPTPPTFPTVSSPNLPLIPKVEGDYIVYDTTLWNTFVEKVGWTIGNATNVGFVILSAIFSIYIIVRIINKYTQ